MKKIISMAVATLMAAMSMFMLSSCEGDDPDFVNPDQNVQRCVKPDYLKAGDKVALVSPSYFTPMENVEKTADLLRAWGFEPVIGCGPGDSNPSSVPT